MMFYRVGRRASAIAIRTFIGPLEKVGLDNIPSDGPFLLVSNHESILDPFYVQVACPRPVHTMAKSTQFAAPGMKFLMPRVLTFPVRRYEIDPQAVRNVLRRLDQGLGVGIYMEGERSWDGVLQRARLGTLRLILKAGVPVIPARVEGAYAVWPRWQSLPGRGTVRVVFEEPFRYPAIHDRAEREARLGEVEQKLRAALGDAREGVSAGS